MTPFASRGKPAPLDPSAPSITEEFQRFLDGDYLGKLVFRSFLEHTLGAHSVATSLTFPLGRYGALGTGRQAMADARWESGARTCTIELKLARVNIRDARRGRTKENWAFNNLLATPNGVKKSYDIAVAIGVRQLGPENPGYWAFERELAGHPCMGVAAWGYDPERCRAVWERAVAAREERA